MVKASLKVIAESAVICSVTSVLLFDEMRSTMAMLPHTTIKQQMHRNNFTIIVSSCFH